ncbi:C_GCAxxG_C_C family protein [Desulfovibrio oxamicus]|uniref:C_GCAxxG_C_C family protein n=1 Tax=Nitratidesulfovibrio oxamicus TaxID=32016 RepID=A0ABS0J8S1_9BACT|nr:DV_1555 family C-GCAxxG-C-C protein [Nitratidesulfovibrio oxamicus]MBG3878781.1 C_GCAxxG_C_C family protein [Nitratidesulfovibrio oxamicus]
MSDDAFGRVLALGAAGYCCTQIMVQLLLDVQGRDVPDAGGGDGRDAVRAAGGLCRGFGLAEGTCGILLGGCMAMGLCAAKGHDGEEPHEALEAMTTEFAEWFRERTAASGGISCGAILGDAGDGGRPDFGKCHGLLLEAHGKMFEVLAAYGVDPTLPREG